MNIEIISVERLAVSFLPMLLVIALMWRWSFGVAKPLYATARMLLQLALVGYVLVYIFDAESGFVIIGVLTVMLVAASWIALNPVPALRRELFVTSLLAISIGGGFTLLLITQGVLQLDPWYRPSYMIPLAGMIFSSSMTNISLALERFYAEIEKGCDALSARNIAFRAAMIPIVNSFFAVGLISLPGMMTGQILSGVSPLVAVRYQVMVMSMIFGAAGLSTIFVLAMQTRRQNDRAAGSAL